MTDITAAMAAIRVAQQRHRNVNGGLSSADLQLLATTGAFSDEPMPYPPGHPIWLERADANLTAAINACDELKLALFAALVEVAHLAAVCATCGNTGQVWTAEQDGTGAWDQACPDCDTPYPMPVPANTGEAPF